MNKAELSKDRADLFNLIIRNFRTTLKNCVLYNPGHPVFDFSIKNLKSSLDSWIIPEERLDLGFSQNSILIGGMYVEDKSETYKEVAGYMHMRGIAAISILKDVSADELIEFFSFMKHEIKDIREKGGILKNLPPSPHLKIKEIDYSALLASVREGADASEEDVWQSITSIAEESREGKLPDSKLEFLKDFLKDPKRSASVLNRIYKDAVATLKGGEAADSIRATITKIYGYFEKNAQGDTKETSKDVADIISNLDPSLVVKLFEEAKVEGEEKDLAKKITDNLSDDFMAEFISTLISSEQSVNENLLKIFDRLMPGEAKSENVASMVADKLFEKKLLNTDTLSQLQISIKEIFKANPTSSFMSQMYKMTVDTFVGKRTDISSAAKNLMPLINEYKKSIDMGRLKLEEVDLLMSILWNEDDPLEFKKFADKTIEIIPELLGLKDVRSIREILELCLERLRPEQQREKDIDTEAKKIMQKIMADETINRIISFISYTEDKERQEDIVYVLKNAKGVSTSLMMDTFVLEKDQYCRDKLSAVLSKMSGDVSDEIERRIEDCEPQVARDLFKVLKELNPERAHAVTKKLLTHKNTNIRMTALESFYPHTDEEKDEIFSIFSKEKDRAVQDKAMIVLLRIEDKKMIERLFKYTGGGFTNKDLVLKLVELCGQMKTRESFSYIKNILLRQPFFGTKKSEQLRVASAVSLRQLGGPESMEVIKKGLNDRSKAVKSMCNIILELEKEAPKTEADKDAI